MVLFACAPVGIAEDWREAVVRVYNRTLTTVSFDGAFAPDLLDGLALRAAPVAFADHVAPARHSPDRLRP